MGSGVISYVIDATGLPQKVSAATPLPVVVTGSGTTASEVQGNIASGSADETTKPVKVGGRYNVALQVFGDGQRADFQTDVNGLLKTSPLFAAASASDNIDATIGFMTSANNTIRTLATSSFVYNGATLDKQRGSAGEGTISKPYAFTSVSWQNTQRLIAIGTTAIIAAGGANVRNYLTGIQMTWPPAIPATIVQILDGAAVIAEFDLAAGGAGTRSLDLTITFPIPLVGTANTALNVAIDTVGPVKFNAQGYRAIP